MGRAALKSVGENPKPTGTFRPGAKGTESPATLLKPRGWKFFTVGRSDDLAAATLENPKRERRARTVQFWILSD